VVPDLDDELRAVDQAADADLLAWLSASVRPLDRRRTRLADGETDILYFIIAEAHAARYPQDRQPGHRHILRPAGDGELHARFTLIHRHRLPRLSSLQTGERVGFAAVDVEDFR